MSKFELTLVSLACQASHGMFKKICTEVETASFNTSYLLSVSTFTADHIAWMRVKFRAQVWEAAITAKS